MMLFLKKKTEGESKPAPVKKPPAYTAFRDFIPLHAHVNPHTLLTKNGELMQIIKIATNTRGLEYESGDSADGEDATVRETIRRALLGAIDNDRFSVWIHTVRKRRPIRHDPRFNEPFASYVQTRWHEKHPWKYCYYNEIYISILGDGQSAKMLDRDALGHVLLPKPNRSWRNAFIDTAYAELEAVVSSVLEKLGEHYNAQRLSIVERIPPADELAVNQSVFYSEPMEFLSLLFNLRSESVPLPEADISAALPTSTLTFGFNAVEAKGQDRKRRFASIMTLKQYREVPADTADRILQAPVEFIITEMFHFIPQREALRQYKEQKNLFDISQDTYAAAASGLNEMLRSNQKRPTDYVAHQINVMVLVDDYKQLDAETAKVQAFFGELGLLTIREDIRFEEAFWAQLPGNFEFIRRKSPINSGRIAGFCRLNRFPIGLESGNHWGSALSLIPTSVNAPYFFNFHYQDNGHSVVFDYNSFGDEIGRALVNFLLCQSRRYNGRLYMFDRDQSARLFFDKMGGQYHSFSPAATLPGQPLLKLNPFELENTPRNQAFLLAWCGSLIGAPLTDAQKDVMRSAIAQVYTLPAEERHLSSLPRFVSDNSLVSALSKWHSGGALAGMVDALEEPPGLAQHGMHAFDMSPVVQRKEAIIPVFSYLLHRIVTSLDGQPGIIALKDAWDLLENAFFAPRLESLLDMLQQNNIAAVFTSQKPADCVDTHSFRALLRKCATQIFLPDDIAPEYMAQDMGDMGLTPNDVRLLQRMQRQRGDFLVKQGGESIALRADIRAIDDVYAILCNDVKNLAAAGGEFAGPPQAGGKP